jgi:hypothetical protein
MHLLPSHLPAAFRAAEAVWRTCLCLLDSFDGLIEVGVGGVGQCAALPVVFFKLGVGVLFGLFVRDAAGVRQDVVTAQANEVIKLRDPVGHVHRPM